MSKNIEPVQAVLQPTSEFYFDKCTFERKADPVFVDGKLNYQFNFERSIARVDDKNYVVSLLCNIFTDQKEVEMQARIVGRFAVDSEDKRVKNQLISKNTVAILFPYLRSQITLLTAQSGLQPVVLPVLNIGDMFEDAPLPGEED